MNHKWAWLTVVVTIATVFANPSADLAGFIPPAVVTIAAAVAAFATTGIAVVQGLGDKTLNTLTAIGAFVATALRFAVDLPDPVTRVLLVIAAVVSAVSTMAPAAQKARLAAGKA